MIILDTNVVSELMRSEPSPAVVGWLGRRSGRLLATTSVTLAEIRYGLALLPSGRRRDVLTQAADELFGAFPDQVLPFDAAAATAYADIVTGREAGGAPIAGFDAQIAAIARTHAATLATRNTKDFADVGIELVDPWRAGSDT